MLTLACERSYTRPRITDTPFACSVNRMVGRDSSSSPVYPWPPAKNPSAVTSKTTQSSSDTESVTSNPPVASVSGVATTPTPATSTSTCAPAMPTVGSRDASTTRPCNASGPGLTVGVNVAVVELARTSASPTARTIRPARPSVRSTPRKTAAVPAAPLRPVQPLLSTLIAPYRHARPCRARSL
jgi:hypothetical protein